GIGGISTSYRPLSGFQRSSSQGGRYRTGAISTAPCHTRSSKDRGTERWCTLATAPKASAQHSRTYKSCRVQLSGTALAPWHARSGAADTKGRARFDTGGRRTLARAPRCRARTGQGAPRINKHQPPFQKETEMRTQYCRQAVYVLILIAAVCLTACKKNVAAAPPAAPPVEPTPPPPVPTITLRAAPVSIDRGQSASLQWETKNATSVRIQPEVGSVTTQGSRSVNPSSSVTYTAVAMGPAGSASDRARITVRVPAAAVPARSEPTRTDTRLSMDELFRQNVQTIYFDFDKSDIRPDQVSRLEGNASWLKQHRGLKFTIEGDCDER